MQRKKHGLWDSLLSHKAVAHKNQDGLVTSSVLNNHKVPGFTGSEDYENLITNSTYSFYSASRI